MKKKINIADTDPLLTYTETTIPSPLEISSDTPTNGKIFFTVEKNLDVLCKIITIAVPIGPLPKEIYMNAPQGSLDTTDWSLSSDFISGKELGLDEDANYTVFTMNNNTQGYAVNTTFKLTISGTVNKVAGPANVELKEFSSPVSNLSYSMKSKSYPMTKSDAPSFYLRNFISSLPATPTVPATEFGNGVEFELSWASNGTYFKLYKKGDTTAVYEGKSTSFLIKGGVANDTTFVVEGTLGDDTLYDAITITVSNPTLTPKQVTVQDTLNVAGATSLANTSVSGSLGVTGQTTLANTSVGSLSVSGQSVLTGTEVKGGLTVSNGQTSLQSTTATSLTVTGQTVLAGVTSKGTSSINGPLIANGTVSMLKGANLIASGTTIKLGYFTALTDGFIVSIIGTPKNVTKMSNAWVDIFIGNIRFSDLGGSTGTFGSGWSDYMADNPSTMCIPVKKGDNFYYRGYQDKNNQQSSGIAFYWYASGNSSAGESTIEKLGKDSNIKIPTAKKYNSSQTRETASQRKSKVTEFISLLENAFDKKVNDKTKNRLVSKLLEL